MNLGPVTKFDKRNRKNSKKSDGDSMSENSDVIVIFRILANLEQSGGRRPNTASAKVIFSVTVTFCLTTTAKKN